MKSLVLLVALVLSAKIAHALQFVYCTEAGPSIFNPQLATDGATFNVTRSIYSRLVQFEMGGLKVQPMLAESWKFSADGKSLTFKLRKDVKWHGQNGFTPTRSLTADDVIYTFQRMSDPKHPYHKVNGGTYKYFNSMEMDRIIQVVEKVDDHTVRIVLARPEASFLPNLAMDFASILSKEYAEYLLKKGTPAQLDQVPVGTGPFAFSRYEKDKRVVLLGHKNYYEGAPQIKELIFEIETDTNKRVDMLLAKKCHLVISPPPDRLAELRANPDTRVMSQPGLNIFYLAFNTTKKPFDDVRVRRAIHHAINRQRIVEKVFQGHAQVAKNPIPPSMWSYNRRVQDYDYNQERALKLLEQAKLPRGTRIRLLYMSESRPYNPDGQQVAELMKRDLESVGFKVQLETKKWTDYLKGAYEGDFDLLQMGWTGDNGDPDNFLNLLLSCAGAEGGNNYSKWCNKKYSHLIGRARVAPSIRKRTQFYEKAQEIFKDQAPWVTISHSTVYKAMLKSVVGYRMTPLGHDIFYPVSIQSERLPKKETSQ